MLESASAELPDEVETLEMSGRSIYRIEEADLIHFTKLRCAPTCPPDFRPPWARSDVVLLLALAGKGGGAEAERTLPSRTHSLPVANSAPFKRRKLCS